MCKDPSEEVGVLQEGGRSGVYRGEEQGGGGQRKEDRDWMYWGGSGREGAQREEGREWSVQGSGSTQGMDCCREEASLQRTSCERRMDLRQPL